MSVILGALITEKTMRDANLSKFTFKVSKSANKYQIKDEVQKNFGVNVIDISTSTVKGRSVRVGTRRNEKILPSWKKAVVSVKKGEKIGLFDLGAEKK